MTPPNENQPVLSSDTLQASSNLEFFPPETSIPLFDPFHTVNSDTSPGLCGGGSNSFVLEDLLPSTIPKRKRCVRNRNPSRKFSSLSFGSDTNDVRVSVLASSTLQLDRAPMEASTSFQRKYHGSGCVFDDSPKKPRDDMSDEIIVINKEATAEALTALTAGFPADSLTDEEIDYGVVAEIGGIEQVNYILIRNYIISRWREDVSNWVTREMFVYVIPKHCQQLLDRAYGYLVSHGYINFGVAPTIKERMFLDPKQPNVIVIGAGLAGLAAARQLMAFGFKVTVLEGRRRAGGRVYTTKLECKNRTAAVDLGGSVLTGTLGNPLGILARQLSLTLHKVKDKCPLYRVDGAPVDPDLDRKVEDKFNQLLDKLSNVRVSMGEVSQDVSLGAALETFRERFNEEEMKLYNWHVANLEYANASLISRLSLAFWDQDDPYDMGGDHCFLPGGNGRLVQALAENVSIHFEKTVQTIRYGIDGVQVFVAGGQIYTCDMALCTVPLGVLKSGSIKFMPELPQRKLDAIRRMGFGLLNKVALLFSHAFWGTDLDTFGHLSDHPSSRGEFFLFYSYATVSGGPLLIALVAGEAAYTFEVVEPAESVQRVLRILRDIYEPQGIEVPDPIQTVCTRWGGDPLSRGSYSNVAVGASGDDYDILAESVGDGRLFFAGEATNRRYPATMHGALLSGFREAANMAHYAKVRILGLKVEKNPSQNAHTCAALLADLFRQPDAEFGSFAVLFGRKQANSLAILQVTFGGQRKKLDPHYSNKLLFEQLQSHFNQQQEVRIYTQLTNLQALQLRDVRGGDEGRLSFLEKIGVKFVGRKGLGHSADSVISSIKAERSNSRRQSQRANNSGISKMVGSTKKRIAKHGGSSNCRVVATKNRSLNASVSNEGKVRKNFNDLMGTSNGLASNPGSVVAVKVAGSNKRSYPGDDGDSIPQNLGNLCSKTSSPLLNPASSSSIGPISNVDMVFLDDDLQLQGSDMQNFVAGCLTPARSGRISLPDDVPMHEPAGASGAPSDHAGDGMVSFGNSLEEPSNTINGGCFHSQNLAAGGISDDIGGGSSNQDSSIFEEIMKDLIPSSTADSSTWQFNGKF